MSLNPAMKTDYTNKPTGNFRTVLSRTGDFRLRDYETNEFFGLLSTDKDTLPPPVPEEVLRRMFPEAFPPLEEPATSLKTTPIDAEVKFLLCNEKL